MTRYAALVCRLSPRPDGSYEGVDLQEKWGREYAGAAWPDLPIEVFADAGISAANGDHRPEFERFRSWVRDGMIARVWCVEQSRLERREVEWFQLAAELDAAGISEVHTNRDGIVRVRDEVAGIKAVLAAGEVRKLRKRVNDRLAENAANGRPPGSKPFGYAHAVNDQGDKTYVIMAEQADAIRWAAEKVLTGWSLANIAAELRGRGLRGGHGGELTAGAVRTAVTNPTVAGKRVHQGRIVGPGNWPPILDEATWQACRQKLSQPRRVRRCDGGDYPVGAAHRGASTGRRYLLTGGLAVCAVCAAPLCASMKQLRGRDPKPYYLCHPKQRRPSGEPAGACVGILGDALERHVVDELFGELDKPEFLDAIAADEHGVHRDDIAEGLRAVERQRDELAGMWATPGELSMSEWQTARRVLAEHEQQLRRELAAVPPPLVHVDIATARGAWPDMTLDEKREFVRLFIACVTVNRATPGTRSFDPGRVTIEWRQR